MTRDASAEAGSRARDLLPEAAASVSEAVVLVPEDAWGNPSPCEGWSVRDVLNHLTSEHLWAPRLLAGDTIADVGDAYEGDVLGADPRASWKAAVARSMLAWAQASDEGRELQMSFGPCTVGEYAQQMLVDLVVHGWDVARGAGVVFDPPADAVEEALHYAASMADPDGVPGLFAAPVETSSEDRLDVLVALLGREPA